MPSYATPTPAPQQTTTEPYTRTCSVAAEPLAQQASSYGNAFLLDQTLGSPPRAGQQWAEDPALRPFYELLNDPSVPPVMRAEAMLRYRNQKLADAPLATLTAIAAGDDDMPLTLESGREGTHFPLFERLGQDPAMQQLVMDLSQRALATPREQVDIAALWEGTRANAAALAGPERADEASMMALQAMATFMNAQKFDRPGKIPVDPQTGLPETMPEGVSPELWAAIDAASQHVSSAPTPDAAVMSHGVDAWKEDDSIPFTADNNFHFWTHAWVSANLQTEHGLSTEQAEAVSAVAGAQYELKPGSFREEHGNAGMKDILVNAEGAAFGSDLVRDPSAPLPAQDAGPPFDVRALGKMGDLDAASAEVLERAELSSLEGLLDAFTDGVLHKDQDRAPAQPSDFDPRLPRPLY